MKESDYEYSIIEIADIMHLSRKEVREIEATALKKIARALKKLKF